MSSAAYPFSLFSGIFLVILAFVYATAIIACRRRRARQHVAELARQASSRNTQNFAAVMNAVQPFKYVAPRHQGDEEAPEESSTVVPECVICLSKVADGEVVKMMPNCVHMFHVDCIDMWLFSHQTCPVCRSPVAPSSVVPVTS